MAGVMASDSVTPTNMNPILLGLGHSGPEFHSCIMFFYLLNPGVAVNHGASAVFGLPHDLQIIDSVALGNGNKGGP